MDGIIDISLPVQPDMPVWPGSGGVRLVQTASLGAGDCANVTRLDCDVHTGTHVDAPRHFIEHGRSVDELRLDVLMGRAWVAAARGVPAITAAVLDGLGIPAGTRRLLLRTDNSEWWRTGVREFQEGYVALTRDAASWIVAHGIELVGIDYLSIQRYRDDPETHRILLQAQTVILEGLNLDGVEPGEYELICLPIRLVGVDGAPARAVLRRNDGGAHGV